MVYPNFTALNAAYANDRVNMGFEEELSYVEDCFDTYEALGFSETYGGPFSEYESYKGMTFKVDRRLSYVEDDADLDCLPMWYITLQNGVQIAAYPEEICVSES